MFHQDLISTDETKRKQRIEKTVRVIEAVGECGVPAVSVLTGPAIWEAGHARMSGTAYGTVVLHCSPESAVGGPLALVQDGDLIELDVSGRRIDLLVDAREMERRRQNFVPPPLPERGWRKLYAQHVTQSDQGSDLDFLMPPSEAD